MVMLEVNDGRMLCTHGQFVEFSMCMKYSSPSVLNPLSGYTNGIQGDTPWT